MTPLLPVFLKLEGRPVLIIGAGNVAFEKIESLLVTGAHLHVVAPWALPQVHQLHQAGRIELHERRYAESDLNGVFLAIAATDDAAVNHLMYTSATSRGILANAVDDPPFCDFYFASVVRRGPLQIAISTAGESPAVAQGLRREIDAALPQDMGPWLAELGSLRREVLSAHPRSEARKRLLHTLAQRDVCGSPNCPSRALAHAPLTPEDAPPVEEPCLS